MYELVKISEHDYYIDCPSKIGIVVDDSGRTVTIDSGNDKDTAKKVLKAIDGMGWKLTAIFNTHSHADHIGGNKLMQTRTGCRVFAPGIECDFTNHPILESACLYGGYPFDALRNKFLMAQESNAEPLTETALPMGWEIIPLPGHCFDMVGYRTPDGNVFLADCLSSRETLDKYGIGYLWDVGAYCETLEKVKTMEAAMFVPAHAAAANEIAELAQYNIDAVKKTAETIVRLCGEKTDFDSLLQMVFAEYGLTMNVQQHALIGSTVRSYLSWLVKQGRVTYLFEDNRMLWAAVK